MEEVIKLDEIDKYNKLFGLETRHPLVSVIDLSKATQWPEHFKVNYGVYALYLKDTYCGNILYGRQSYDYQDGTIVSFAPGQVAETEMLKNVQPYCKSLGLSEILVCCLDTNEGSRRTILKNGGRFDGTAYRADENKTLERYWITL